MAANCLRHLLGDMTINPCVGRESALCGNSVNAIFGVGFHHANSFIKTNVAKPLVYFLCKIYGSLPVCPHLLNPKLVY